MSKRPEATYLGRPRQRIIALAIEKAIKDAKLTEQQGDDVIFSVFDSIKKNNGAKPMGYAKHLGIEGE